MESETTASGKSEGQIQIVAQSHCKSGSWVVTKTVLIVSADPNAGRHLKQQLERAGKRLKVLVADNLMDAFAIAEEHGPNTAILDRGFADLPEFSMMKSLFSALKTTCLLIGEAGSPRTVDGLRVLRRSDPASAFLRFIETPPTSVVKSPTTPSTTQLRSKGKLILIGSSTGGVEALNTVLRGFPKDCPPTMIVQHTGEDFGSGLIDILSQVCPARVVAARHGLTMEPGLICIAAGQRLHLELSSGSSSLRAHLREGPPVSGHIPSVDKLFLSARPVAQRVVAAILTGMGKDGAQGMLALRQAGASTFAQDEQSSVVYGMPRAAWQIGAAQRQIPLNRMARTLLGASAFQS